MEISTPRVVPTFSPSNSTHHHLRRVSTHLPATSGPRDAERAEMSSKAPDRSRKHGAKDPYGATTNQRRQANDATTGDMLTYQTNGDDSRDQPVAALKTSSWNPVCAQCAECGPPGLILRTSPEQDKLPGPISRTALRHRGKRCEAFVFGLNEVEQIRGIVGWRRDVRKLDSDIVAAIAEMEELSATKAALEEQDRLKVPGAFLDAVDILDEERRRLLLAAAQETLESRRDRLQMLEEWKSEAILYEQEGQERMMALIEHVIDKDPHDATFGATHPELDPAPPTWCRH